MTVCWHCANAQNALHTVEDSFIAPVKPGGDQILTHEETIAIC
jgi:hypothetical protein